MKGRLCPPIYREQALAACILLGTDRPPGRAELPTLQRRTGHARTWPSAGQPGIDGSPETVQSVNQTAPVRSGTGAAMQLAS